MYGVGSIINVKNIVFKKTSGKEQMKIDHAYRTGRPCLVIYEDTDKIYLLPILGYKGKDFAHEIRLTSDTSNKESCVSIRDIFCRNLAYYKELNQLGDKELYNILIEFVNYQENVEKDEFYDLISESVKSKIEELNKTLTTKTNNKGNLRKSKNK